MDSLMNYSLKFDMEYCLKWFELLFTNLYYIASGRNRWFLAIAYEITITYLTIVLEYLSDHTQDITKKKRQTGKVCKISFCEKEKNAET